jgi:hypothetical protein
MTGYELVIASARRQPPSFYIALEANQHVEVRAMFDRARDQLARSKQAVDALKHSMDERVFLLRFNEVVASFQMVLIDLLREGRGERIPGFDQWYADAMHRMDDDELMVLVRQARDFDFADGPHRLRFVSGTLEVRVDEHGRPANSKSWCAIPHAIACHACMDNAPRVHRGEELDRNDPVSLSEQVLETLERLIGEAESAVGVAA